MSSNLREVLLSGGPAHGRHLRVPTHLREYQYKDPGAPVYAMHVYRSDALYNDRRYAERPQHNINTPIWYHRGLA